MDEQDRLTLRQQIVLGYLQYHKLAPEELTDEHRAEIADAVERAIEAEQPRQGELADAILETVAKLPLPRDPAL